MTDIYDLLADDDEFGAIVGAIRAERQQPRVKDGHTSDICDVCQVEDDDPRSTTPGCPGCYGNC